MQLAQETDAPPPPLNEVMLVSRYRLACDWDNRKSTQPLTINLYLSIPAFKDFPGHITTATDPELEED